MCVPEGKFASGGLLNVPDGWGFYCNTIIQKMPDNRKKQREPSWFDLQIRQCDFWHLLTLIILSYTSMRRQKEMWSSLSKKHFLFQVIFNMQGKIFFFPFQKKIQQFNINTTALRYSRNSLLTTGPSNQQQTMSPSCGLRKEQHVKELFVAVDCKHTRTHRLNFQHFLKQLDFWRIRIITFIMLLVSVFMVNGVVFLNSIFLFNLVQLCHAHC